MSNWLASQIRSPAAAAPIRVIVPLVRPYISVLPRRFRVCPSRSDAKESPLFEEEPARIEGRRPELAAELRERGGRVVGEHVFDHPHLAVVVEGHVHVRVRDEVHGRALARRAADCQPEPTRAGGEQEEGRGKDRTRPLLRVAEEAPRPVAGLDAACEAATARAPPPPAR